MRVFSAISERIPQRELDQPGRSDGGDNLPERRLILRKTPICRATVNTRSTAERSFHIVERWISKVCMVPNVEEIRRETQVLPLGNPEVFDQRKIPILLEWPAINVSTEIPKCGYACSGIRCWRSNEVVDVQITIETGMDIA
jgi:hypothetical protein